MRQKQIFNVKNRVMLQDCMMWLLSSASLVWLGRLVVVVVLVMQFKPSAPRAIPIDVLRAPIGLHSHVCVHTRLIDEVFEWKIQQSLELVRAMGATTIVEFFPWAYFEGQARGRYDWRQADIILRHARANGLRVIARLGLVPEWARPDVDDYVTTLNYLPEARFEDFAHFASVFAERYEDDVDAIIIWNEPNLSFEWGYRQVDPIAYTALLRQSYEAIKSVTPDMLVLGGALAPTLEPMGSSNGLNDLIYLEMMYEVGAGEFMDGLAVHTYGFLMPPESPPAPDVLNFKRVKLLQALGERYALDLPIYITESGWNDHPRWSNAVTPGERTQYTVRALQIAEDWDWLETLCLWALRYPSDTLSYPDNYTLITPDFRLKPIYRAVQAYALNETLDTPLWLPAPKETEE